MSTWALSLIILIGSMTGIYREQSPALMTLAQIRAVEISANFSHRYLDELNNGQWDSWGEVIGYNAGMADPVASIADGWRKSASHWSVLTDRSYTKIGCGAFKHISSSYSLGYRYYFVCILGNPSDAPAPKPEPAPQPAPPPVVVLPDAAMAPPK